jgi:hypothetical protein
MAEIRIEIVEARVARAGPLTFGLVLLAVIFPPIVLPLLWTLAVLVILTAAFRGSIPMDIRESRGATVCLSPRSPPLA